MEVEGRSLSRFRFAKIEDAMCVVYEYAVDLKADAVDVESDEVDTESDEVDTESDEVDTESDDSFSV